MSPALERKRIDRRGLALSIPFHLLLLLLFLLNRQQSHDIPAPPVATPPMTLDLSVGPEQSPTKLQKPDSAAKPSAEEQPVKAATAPASPSAPASTAQPVVLPVVPPPVQLPTFASAASATASVASSSTGAGISAESTGGGSGGKGAGTGAGGGGGGTGGGAITAERPDWIEKPTETERLIVLSHEAIRDHANGWAILSCLVTPWKGVRHCKVLSESADSTGDHPYHFGQSALRLSQNFRIRPPMRNGKPRYDIPVRIPVYWTWN